MDSNARMSDIFCLYILSNPLYSELQRRYARYVLSLARVIRKLDVYKVEKPTLCVLKPNLFQTLTRGERVGADFLERLLAVLERDELVIVLLGDVAISHVKRQLELGHRRVVCSMHGRSLLAHLFELLSCP